MTPEGMAQLEEDEGRRRLPYDDFTGKPLVKGDVVQGNITIGVGRNLSAQGLANDEINFCFKNNIRDFEEFLYHTFPLWNSFSPKRQDALVNLAFNEGTGGFLKFVHMIDAIRRNDWDSASVECEDSRAYRTPNLHDRYRRIADALKDG